MMRRQQNVDKRIKRNQEKMMDADEDLSMSSFGVDSTDLEKLIQSDSGHDEPPKEKQNVRKDLHNIALLMFLYLLQGIPLGLSGSIPFILSSRKVSYADQGTFSFALWPFSLKLLW